MTILLLLIERKIYNQRLTKVTDDLVDTLLQKGVITARIVALGNGSLSKAFQKGNLLLLELPESHYN